MVLAEQMANKVLNSDRSYRFNMTQLIDTHVSTDQDYLLVDDRNMV